VNTRITATPFILPCLAALSMILAITAFAVEMEVPTGLRIVSEYWATRLGVSARVLMMAPPEPRAGVILLPGGHGNINLDVQAHIGWGRDDFVIRTRASYPRAGFLAVVPDIAIDRKPPAKLDNYRRSESQAYDLGAISDHLRGLTEKVFVVAYDRGATSALNTAARRKMDLISGLVLISPILESVPPSDALLQDGARLALAKMPVLLISHAADECSSGAVKELSSIATVSTARSFRAISVTDGQDQYQLSDPFAYYRDPCNKEAHHALAGSDGYVSNIITQWLLTQAGF
jgi:pimeloyl-ACP methyl ester carboxylesterase